MPYPRPLEDDEELLPLRREEIRQQENNVSGNVVYVGSLIFIVVMYILIALTCKGVL